MILIGLANSLIRTAVKPTDLHLTTNRTQTHVVGLIYEHVTLMVVSIGVAKSTVG